MPDLKNSIKEIRKYFSLHLMEKLPLFVKLFHPMLVMEFSAIRNRKSRLILTIPMVFFTVWSVEAHLGALRDHMTIKVDGSDTCIA
jgi:hypothetical protein